MKEDTRDIIGSMVTNIIAKVIIGAGKEYVDYKYNNQVKNDENGEANKNKFNIMNCVNKNLMEIDIDESQVENIIKNELKKIHPKSMLEQYKNKREREKVLKRCADRLRYESYERYKVVKKMEEKDKKTKK